jgi:hypothetical protein
MFLKENAMKTVSELTQTVESNLLLLSKQCVEWIRTKENHRDEPDLGVLPNFSRIPSFSRIPDFIGSFALVLGLQVADLQELEKNSELPE